MFGPVTYEPPAVARRIAEQRHPAPRRVDEVAAIALLEQIHARRTP